MITETYILKRIQIMQEELERLKKTIVRGRVQKPVSLRGIWKGADFSDEEIEDARRSWFKE